MAAIAPSRLLVMDTQLLQRAEPAAWGLHPNVPMIPPSLGTCLQLPAEGNPEPGDLVLGTCQAPLCLLCYLLYIVLAPQPQSRPSTVPPNPFQTAICNIKPGSLCCSETLTPLSGGKKLPERGRWGPGQSRGEEPSTSVMSPRKLPPLHQARLHRGSARLTSG